MMKEEFQKRLSEIDKAIEEKNKALQQTNADLNLLLGCRAESLFWLNKITNPVDFVPVNDKALSKEELKQMLGADEITLMKTSDIK